MLLDTVFFDRLVKTMETNHNIVRSNMSNLQITEAWIAFGDQLIGQCKAIIATAKTSEQHEAVFSTMATLFDADFNEDMFDLSLEKTMKKLEKLKDDIIIEDNEVE